MTIHKITIPLLVVAFLTAGYFLRTAFTQPTTNTVIDNTAGQTLVCTVQGVKCKGTAEFFTSLYQDVTGIKGIQTFASEHRVIFTYDQDLISPDSIRRIMEAPIPLEDGSTIQLFTCLSMEAD